MSFRDLARPLASCIAVSLFSALPGLAQPNLGKIDFPTSAGQNAQAAFIEGVLFLHSFEYEDAATAFRRAQNLDATLGMAYWGEAMTYNHPIWMEQDHEAAQNVLSRLGGTLEERARYFPTPREQAFHHAIETLYGNTPESTGKTKEERDDLYMDAMRRMHETFPDDPEAATFYALSILGAAHEGRDFALYMHAASVAFKVWEINRLHPGAAHYLIHSFDDPVHARLGLPMARAYSSIAPSAAHAQHMTSHIFVALGMWDDVVAANEVASRVQNERMAAANRRESVCGHYTFWLEYGYLQQGRIDDAKAVLDACYARMADEPRAGERWYFGQMLARYVVDTQDYSSVASYTYDFEDGDTGGRDYHFALAYAAAQTGRVAEAAKHQIEISEHANEDDQRAPILSSEIDGILALHHGEIERAVTILTKAAESEASLPFDFGPPDPAKPTYELLGESLVELGRLEEANAAFRKQLDRTINRTASLEGLANTARELGDTATASEASAKLASIQGDREGGE